MEREDKSINWKAIEGQYRLGQKNIERLAEEFQVSSRIIAVRAQSWLIDKAQGVEGVGDSRQIENAGANSSLSQGQVKVADRNGADVVLEHRDDLRRLRVIWVGMLAELESITANSAHFEHLGEMLDQSGPDQSGRWKKDESNEVYRRVISLSGRIDNAKKLVHILERIVKAEREAFGIKGVEKKASETDEILKKIADSRGLAH